MNKQSYTLCTGETVQQIHHPSGLTILVYPKAGFRSAYAVFATRYGSVDTSFIRDGKPVTVPAGIAHYLEHKLFENEDCDAFEQYAKTGASANAYTSFDRTAYLFSCTDRLEDSLKILLDFVQAPYFTEQTVQKECGIIGQEIRMCNDSPSRCVLFNLLENLYEKNPVRVDIAGTEESISHITPELLYGCYDAFYNLHNMVLAVAGGVTAEQVLEVADKALKPAPELSLKPAPVTDEPEHAVCHYVEQTMPVALPLFYLGYKCPVSEDGYTAPADLAASAVLLELLCGKSSGLYAELMQKELINDEFGGEHFEGMGFRLFLFAGESHNPQAVRDAIAAAIEQLRTDGLDHEAFAAAKAGVYGDLLRRLNSPEDSGELLIEDHFYNRPPFALLDAAAALNEADVERVLSQCLHSQQACLSVILPKEAE